MKFTKQKNNTRTCPKKKKKQLQNKLNQKQTERERAKQMQFRNCISVFCLAAGELKMQNQQTLCACVCLYVCKVTAMRKFI